MSRYAGPRPPAVDPDLVPAFLLTLVALVLCLSRHDAPAASIAFIGVGSCAYLLLSAATHRFPHRAAELRGLLTTAGTLAAAGFVLRLGPHPADAMREWALFVVGVIGFFPAAGWAERFAATRTIWWAAVAISVVAAGAMVPARGPDGTRAAAQLAYNAPLPALAIGLAGLAATGAIRYGTVRTSLTLQAWVVAVPPVAVLAYTGDPAALPVIGLPLLAVLLTLHLAAWRDGHRLLMAAGAATVGVLAGSLLTVGVWALAGRTARVAFPDHRDLLGAPPEHDTRTVAGPIGLMLLMLFAAVLLGQLAALFGAVLRRDPHAATAPLSAGIATLLAVQLAGPIAAAAGLPVPAGLATLPLASDGASFLITLAGLGFLFGAGGRRPTLPDQRRPEQPAGAARPAAEMPLMS